MDNEKELRRMFDLPITNPDVYASIKSDNDSLDGILGVDLPSKEYKPRGKAFAEGYANPTYEKWRCVQCDLRSNYSGVVRHQKSKGHVGKQRVFPEMEKLGIV